MSAEIGHFALWLALFVAAVLGTLPMLGAARGREDWMALARPATRLLFVLVALALLVLLYKFLRALLRRLGGRGAPAAA